MRNIDITDGVLACIEHAVSAELGLEVIAARIDSLAGGCYGHVWTLSDGRVLLITDGDGNSRWKAIASDDINRSVIVSVYRNFREYLNGYPRSDAAHDRIFDPSALIDKLS